MTVLGFKQKKHYGSLWEPILFCVKDKNNYKFNSQNILVEAKTGSKRKLIDYRGDKPTLVSSEGFSPSFKEWENPFRGYYKPKRLFFNFLISVCTLTPICKASSKNLPYSVAFSVACNILNPLKSILNCSGRNWGFSLKIRSVCKARTIFARLIFNASITFSL